MREAVGLHVQAEDRRRFFRMDSLVCRDVQGL